MKASPDFILREIAGEYILVPTGPAAARFNGLITLNETAHSIFLALQKGPQSVDSLADAVTSEFDVPEETARSDVREFLSQLRQVGALVEP